MVDYFLATAHTLMFITCLEIMPMLLGSDHMPLFFSICIPGFKVSAQTPPPKQWKYVLRTSQATLFVHELTAF